MGIFSQTLSKGGGAVDTSALAGPAQYAAREKLQFPFLSPANRRDAAGRRPGSEGFDSSTLQLPKVWSCRLYSTPNCPLYHRHAP
jgi:hypothetical protein